MPKMPGNNRSMIIEAFECQLCEEIYFKTFEALKDHLECYHPREFDMLKKTKLCGKEHD